MESREVDKKQGGEGGGAGRGEGEETVGLLGLEEMHPLID